MHSIQESCYRSYEEAARAPFLNNTVLHKISASFFERVHQLPTVGANKLYAPQVAAWLKILETMNLGQEKKKFFFTLSQLKLDSSTLHPQSIY